MTKCYIVECEHKNNPMLKRTMVGYHSVENAFAFTGYNPEYWKIIKVKINLV